MIDYQRGRDYFDRGQYTEALSHLKEAFRKYPAHPDINFFLGRAAFETGDYETALMAFDRVLIMDPEASRVRLEIARCHIRLGAYEAARNELREVLETDPPPVVRQNIEMMLAAIQDRERSHSINGVCSFGVSWDDNVRASPISERIGTVLGDVTLSGESAKAQDDIIYAPLFLLSHTYQKPDSMLSWVSSGLVYSNFYKDEHDIDINLFGLASGPQFQGSKTLWSVQGLYNYLIYGNDRYLGSVGIETMLYYSITPHLLISLSARGEDKTFYTEPEKDATNVLAAIGIVFGKGANRISLMGVRERENAEDDVNTYDRYSCSLQYDRQLFFDFSIFAAFRYQNSDYRERDSQFNHTRADEVFYYTFGISKMIWESDDGNSRLTAELKYTYTDAESNIDLYTYEKHVAGSSVTWQF